MKKLLTAVVIVGCGTLFFAALPVDAKIAANGLAPMPVNERLAGNGLAPMPVNAKIAANGVSAAGLDLSGVGLKALGR
jgi:hypothetical protein